NRTVTITPATNKTGQATLTLTVSDGMASASTSFNFTVNPTVVEQPPVLSAPTLSSEDVLLSWTSVQGHNYRVQYKDDWSATNWTDLAGTITATSTNATTTDSLSTNGQRFYRVIFVP